MKCLIPFATFLILIAHNPAFSQKLDKYIEKFQKYYDGGEIKKAYKINEKLKINEKNQEETDGTTLTNSQKIFTAIFYIAIILAIILSIFIVWKLIKK